MNYHAHFPAGVAFAAAASFFMGQPLDAGVLIAGGIGGILPDIDHHSGESAVSSMGSKAAKMASKASGGKLGFLKPVGNLLDMVILKPVTMLWLLLAQKVFSPIYLALYTAFGSKIGWDDDDPSQHRGGFTHSLWFIAFTSLFMYPIAHFLLGNDMIWLGFELGILSHLFADSMCMTGVKWFWPWIPRIGFSDEKHEKGNGIRLLPVSMLMSTGKCPTKNDYLELGAGTPRYREMKSFYYKEKGWQWAFKALAVLFILLSIVGIGPGSGAVAFGDSIITTSKSGAYATAGQESQSSGSVGDASGNEGTHADGDVISGTLYTDEYIESSGENVSIGEHLGAMSVSSVDIDASSLPRGIVKLPDESLYVVGVGILTEDSVKSSSLGLTEEEQMALMSMIDKASNEPKPEGTAGVGEGGSSDGSDEEKPRGNGFTDLLEGLFGDSAQDSGLGFLGITPVTDNEKS